MSRLHSLFQPSILYVKALGDSFNQTSEMKTAESSRGVENVEKVEHGKS